MAQGGCHGYIAVVTSKDRQTCVDQVISSILVGCGEAESLQPQVPEHSVLKLLVGGQVTNQIIHCNAEWTNQIAASVGADLVWCVWVGPDSSWEVGRASVCSGVTFRWEGKRGGASEEEGVASGEGVWLGQPYQ